MAVPGGARSRLKGHADRAHSPGRLGLKGYLEVVALLGTQATTLEPRLPLLVADVAAFRHLTGLTWPLRDLVVVHPGASDPRRRWPAAPGPRWL